MDETVPWRAIDLFLSQEEQKPQKNLKGSQECVPEKGFWTQCETSEGKRVRVLKLCEEAKE